ncbi:hypothetical protein A3D23_07210 [candidate division WOR-1 bacterium RIFCSPHIGHO2_02_FULL_53_26]|uniref:Outer membrane lipoprotein-sorting protein n=1 Tax=Candidatus Taylorbacteria bacterium RIFCSPHIGHO2_01_FULL_46_22b TaxID=1802301 RepID=A0A1G2M474_9BACT|nr:MAG: hypothetical protein A3D23_07210 [candidate division WOR-1 bacterium RIFCSPHIGHO2_02_FULL_53_26]OHA18700.1 MAG: hypothetical protein A2664_00180 [Candidatus Taylorbacteria bacterium RIFCSPHIGHO2_01_FULL_46_22b]
MNKNLAHIFIPIFGILVSSILMLPSFAADLPAEAGLSLDDLIAKIQSNQSKIHDMYAETTTTITSNMVMPGQESRGTQKIIQKSKMWTKGQDKSKIEMLSPTRQITIINGDQMATINPETGQKVVQDLKKLRDKSGGLAGGQSGQMTLDKISEFFYLSVRKLDPSTTEGVNTYVVTGVPKKENKFMGKMEFYVDSERWAPVKILMYDPKNRPMSQTEIEYSSVEDKSATASEGSVIFVPLKNKSVVSSPMGKMEIEVEYTTVKVNGGISDKEFVVE